MKADDVQRFASRPAQYFGHSWHAMQHVPTQDLEDLQLEALRMRFRSLVREIPTLSALASEHQVTSINRLEDVVPLLFQHTVYKSYPQSLLLKNRFADLTRWLDRLTIYDLSTVDVGGCDSIDSWLDALDGQTDLRVLHSSGTTGTMSFLPRSTQEWGAMFEALRCGLFQFSDTEGTGGRHEGEFFNLVWPLYRRGRSAIMRIPEMSVTHLLGSEDRLYAARPGRMSSDSMFFAGRLRAAAARGEADQLTINPALRARRDELAREHREMQESLPRFLELVTEQLRGERVWVLATWNVLYDIAKAGLERGLTNVFAPDSLVTTGGGAKGQVVPEDWEESVKRFVGVERVQHAYVMSEITALNKMCEYGRYHIEPWVILFVLNPSDGAVLPRQGQQTGRAAVFDLAAGTYWGGFITGDEVTASYDECGCGRTTPHLARAIERFSDKKGGDDKITCLASEDAHRAALEFLNGRLG